MNDQSALAQPIEITSQSTVKNRLFKSAMSEQLASRDNEVTAELVQLFRTWAQGGTGLLTTGNVMIDRGSLGEPKNVVLDQASDLSMFKKWAQAGSQNNTQIWMQLNHPGKQIHNMLCWEPVAPSAVPLTGNGNEMIFNCPRALTETEILELIEKFAWAATQAKDCGFSGVQIHSAHGYLINQFLSPHHNRRDDQWGGSLENRMRFLREIYRAIRKAVGNDFPIGVKLNSADFQKGGFNEDDSLQVLHALQDDGINLIEISGGNYENPALSGGVKKSTAKREAYFLDYAEKAQKILHVPLVVTGGFRSGSAMNAALESGATDMIGLARPLAVDPYVSSKLLADKEYRITLKKLTTGFRSLDVMALLDITWYENQLALIGKGKPTNPNLSVWLSVMNTFADLGLAAFKKRRA